MDASLYNQRYSKEYSEQKLDVALPLMFLWLPAKFELLLKQVMAIVHSMCCMNVQ